MSVLAVVLAGVLARGPEEINSAFVQRLYLDCVYRGYFFNH